MSRSPWRAVSAVSVVALAVALAACTSTIHKKSTISDVNTLSIDAKQRLVLVGTDPYGRRITCVEPSPDALVARAAVLAAQGRAAPQIEGASAGQFSAGFSGGSTESAASIGLRTTSIQLMRDGYYRLCEGLMNGVITQDEYRRVLATVDSAMAVYMAIDGISGMRAAPAVAITAGSVSGSSNTGTGDGGGTTAATAGTSPAVSIQNFNPPPTNPGDVQAKAIADIVDNYLRYRTSRAAYVVQ